MDAKTNVTSTDSDEPEVTARCAVSPRRRMAITLFVVVTLGAILVQHMPDSVIKTNLMAVARPYLNMTGLDQTWSIFSPNPRQGTVYVLARVDRLDGSVAFHPIPTGIGPSEYWGYRWQKYGESLSEAGGSALLRPYAEWVVGQDRREGGDPVRVTLVRRASRNLPPGSEPDALPFVDQDFYTAPVISR
jgi:hypothetical protein